VKSDRIGGDLFWDDADPNSKIFKSMSVSKCQESCNDRDDCVGITYRFGNNTCMMKGSVGLYPLGSYDIYDWYQKFTSGEQIYENPAFTGKSTAAVTGTGWANYTTGWDTYMTSSAHGTIYLSWHPFSQDSSKQWASWTGADESCGIKYPGKVILKMYMIDSTSAANNYTPDEIVVEASNDGTTWTELQSHTTPSENVGYNKNKKTTIGFRDMSTNNTAYSHYRVRIPTGGHYNNINNFKLFTTLPV